MAANEHSWETWLERLYNLRRDKTGSHERPHKPVLLLSIIDLMDRKIIVQNQVAFTDELVATFKRYFEVVRSHDDKPTIQNPFFYLCSDKFWSLVPKTGQSVPSGAPSVAELRQRVAYGQFDEGLWNLIKDETGRHQLREALIARYFPESREKLAPLAAASSAFTKPDALRDEWPPGRDGGFRGIVLEIYDYQCAACGRRVVLDDLRMILAVAAHIIPFCDSYNDKPTNGMALCPNHHWAMDNKIIAPCPDVKKSKSAGIWRVNDKWLDDRIEGQRELVALAGKRVMPPKEQKFYPAIEGLRWREERLAKARRGF